MVYSKCFENALHIHTSHCICWHLSTGTISTGTYWHMGYYKWMTSPAGKPQIKLPMPTNTLEQLYATINIYRYGLTSTGKHVHQIYSLTEYLND